MAIQDIQRDLRGGIKYPRFINKSPMQFNIANKKHYTVILESSTADTANIEVNIVGANAPFILNLSYFEVTGGKLIKGGTIVTSERVLYTTRELKAGIPVLLHLETNIELSGNLIVSVENYSVQPLLFVQAEYGYESRGEMYTKKREVHCNQPLVYRLLDGSLPDGLELLRNGTIRGVIGNLDCDNENDDYSPSYNWFFDNHDDTREAWARVWKFKVEISIEGMPEVTAERWFCLKVYNNWSLDAERFNDKYAIEVSESVGTEKQYQPITLSSLCSEIERPIFVPSEIDLRDNLCGYKAKSSMIEIDGILLDVNEIEFSRMADCVGCNDPTRQKVIETYSIPHGTKIRTPDEFLKYYLTNRDNYDSLIMELHNSVLLPEVYKRLKEETPNRHNDFEIKITKDEVSIIKYFASKNLNLDDIDDKMAAIRNISNQSLPTTIHSMIGVYSFGVLTW